jgi:tRNA (mo5U34)-methyltransferase
LIQPIVEGGLIDPVQLRAEVARLKWYHAIDLGQGIVTPGADKSVRKLETIHLPARLDGLSVLDIGAWDGFFAFEAERRGAMRVVANDTHVWHHPAWGRAAFELARRARNSQVEDAEVEVLDLSPDKVGIFDVVLFLGVLYHMQHPLLALERVASVTRRQLILETHVDMLGFRRPAAAFYPGADLKDDGSNWWGPNLAAVSGLLRTAGFKEVKLVYVTRYPGRVARAMKQWRSGGKAIRAVSQGRAVFHAFK